ncbi:MAG: hypothetical protein R3298_11190, partial [Gammaproteobacteria bacterium]|nr:hypothetical protein [Gammaproteobacteria bacterium]
MTGGVPPDARVPTSGALFLRMAGVMLASLVAAAGVAWLAGGVTGWPMTLLAGGVLLGVALPLLVAMVLRPLQAAYGAQLDAVSSIASEDPRTGLLNRRQLEEHLMRSLATASRSGQLAAV